MERKSKASGLAEEDGIITAIPKNKADDQKQSSILAMD